ncbi:MAG: glycosyltransferase family 4 protein [Chitinophagales bacterium]|nr:glycosyltransferase family 4 protein [Chitinophagales bacterium]
MNIRIAHISTAMTWRGGERQISYLHSELAKQGVYQLILCAKGSAMAKHCQEHGWNYVVAKKKGSLSLPFAKAIAQSCKKEGIQMAHIHDSHAHNNALLAQVLFGLKIPMVLSRRVDFPISPLSAFKYNHPSIRRIICVSQAIRHILAPAIRDKTKLEIIHSGIDLDDVPAKDAQLRKELGIADEVPLIGNIAAIAPHKDMPTFFDTATIFHKSYPQAHFVWIGEGKVEEHRAILKQRGMDAYVHLLGFRPNAKALLAALDVMLVTSETEGLGSSILDAMWLQVPIVATQAGGIIELVEEGSTGLLAATKDAKGLARQLERLLNDPELKRQLIANAREKARQFGKERTAELTLNVYKEMLGQR